MKYYIHANTDQVYSALTNNSITSYATTIEQLQHKTLSFLSDNFIYLSKSILPKEYRNQKTDDIYFPVTIEVDFDGVDFVPCYEVLTENGKAIVASDISNINESTDNAFGAFVCGEIPFAFVTAILFENEENQIRFRKPSPDLWFPEELYGIITDNEEQSSVSFEEITELSKEVDGRISDDDKKHIASIVNKRNRYKGLYYFTLRETNGWQSGNIKSNIDTFLVDVLDEKQGADGLLRKEISASMLALKNDGYDVSDFENIEEKDEILSNNSDSEMLSLDKKVLETVIKMYFDFSKDVISVSRESIEDIKKTVEAESIFKDEVQVFDIISSFLKSSDMNPKSALDKLQGHPVCKSLMKFLDSSDNDGFMKYGCEDLNQYERRYAYMMFGALKGMRFVEREQKSNVAFEHRLEELATKKYSDNLLISSVPKYTGNHPTYGIDVKCSYCMGKKTALEILSNKDNIDKVKLVYELIKKDKAFKVEKLEYFEKPCSIILCAGFEDADAVTINADTLEELNNLIKDKKAIDKYQKNHPMTTRFDLFVKKYLLNEKWFTTLFEKYSYDIQQICR